jgi:hypothetical protein
LSGAATRDYRPTLQAAGQAFLGEAPFPAGVWDELCVWVDKKPAPRARPVGSPANSESEAPPAARPAAVQASEGPFIVLRTAYAWGYLRAAHFSSRPGHADQLHFDLWWEGANLALDPGTYLYNALPPWDNCLSGSLFHNTMTVNGLDQMQRAGRFLYLRWAQARLLRRMRLPDGSGEVVEAEHDGYRRLGIVHRRQVACQGLRWTVVDEMLPIASHSDRQSSSQSYSFRLHWLLPDWPWKLQGTALQLDTPRGPLRLESSGLVHQVQLARAGKLLAGADAVHPATGWISPTYGQKYPALSLAIKANGAAADLPLRWVSEWLLPEGGGGHA